MKIKYTQSFALAVCLLVSTISYAQYYPGGFAKSKINIWLDAADSSTLTRDSAGFAGNVTTWKDKANNLSATQGTSANRPHYTTQNGKTLVEFNGTKNLDIAANALGAPQNGYNLAQVVYVYPDISTSLTDFRVCTYSTNNVATQGVPQIGIKYLSGTGNNKFVVSAIRNNTGYYYTSYNDLRGQWCLPGNYTPGNLPTTSSLAFSNYYYNGGGTLSSNGAVTPPSTLTTTIGNRYQFTNSVHWGISETVLAGYDTKTSGKRIIDLYLATKWGMLDTLINSYGQLYYPPNPAFNNNLVGIGIEAAGDTTNATGSNNGLGLQNINGVSGFLRKQGSYIMAADNALTGNVSMATGITRWNRAWYVSKTDLSNYGGLLNVFFDFTTYGQAGALDTANNSYYLLYNPTNGYFNSDSNYIVQVTSYQQIAGSKQLSFLLDGLNLKNGFYTIVYAPRNTSVAAIPNLATFIPATISISPSPTIPSVYAGNTFNYVQIDSSSITYPVAYYKIYASVNGGALTAIDSTVGTPTYYPHYNLTNGNSYKYKISAVYAPGKESNLSDSIIGVPNNNTPQWLIFPQYSESGKIFMAASAPLAGLPLKFYFDNVAGGGHSSGYQKATNFTDTALTNGNTYSYRYKFMDTVKGVSTESGWSATQTVLLSDSAQGGYTFNMTYLDPNTAYAPYGIGPATILPSNQDMTGLRYIKHVPAVGQHPRIYCSPSDSTEIRYRLKNTPAGIAASRFIHAYTTLVQLGFSGYSKTAYYNKDTLGNQYFTNVGAIDTKTLYDSLYLGDIGVTNNYANLWGGNYAKMAYNFSHEAMECWIYRNQTDTVTNTSYATRAKKLATALTVWARKVIADTTIVPALNMSNFGGLHNAMAYDFLYDQMTKVQQDTVRMAILKTLPDSSKEHGAWAPSYTTTTNWATFGGEIICNIAVEGEPGYAAKDSGLLRGWVKTVWNFLTYGIYPTGDMYEGIGKNRLNEFLLVAMAKRGFSLLGHPNIRAYAQKYLPAVVQPFGYSLIGTDILGGTGTNSPSTGGWKHTFMDLGGLKWAFPADSSVDFIWKNAMQRQYANQTGITNNYYAYNNTTCGDNYGAGFNTHVPGLLFASNYFAAPVTSYAQAALSNNKFYFDSLGGQAVMRSGFDSTSSMVFFACRQDGGGHTYANKNEVLYSALGRIWFPRVTTIASGQSTFDLVSTTQVSSAVLVNDLGVSPDTGTSWSSGVAPGRMVFYKKTDSIMTIAGDATHAYSYQWNNSGFGGLLYDNPLLSPPSVNKINDGYNKYRYSPFYSFDNIALYNRLTFTDNFTPPYYYVRAVERPYFNGILKKVFRTVAMIQATNPYVIVADDAQKDNASSNYKWITPIAPDLSVDTTYANLSNNNYKFDVVLKEPSATGNRRLLIRVLNATGAISSTLAGGIDSTTYTSTGLRRFKIEANAVDPQFKVLLFPFQYGDALPVTTWSADKSKVYITNAGVTNTISFSLDSAGRTNIGLNSGDTGISWTGAIDTIWNKSGNWATGVIPAATDNVVIPSTGITNMPAITNAIAYANKISIQTGATLRVDSVLQLAGDMTLQGSIVGLGIIKTSSNSTSPFPAAQTWNVNIEYNKSTGGQTIVGGTYKRLSVNASTAGSTSTAAANLVVNGVLNIATANTLNMGSYNLSGTVTTATGTGILQTQSTTNPCIPSGVTWAGQVQLNSASGPQYIPAGTYQNLNVNTSSFGTITATGNVSVIDTLKLATKSTLDLGTNLLGGTLKIVSGNGTLRTANNTTTGALPPNATWAGNVVYYSSSTQTVAPGTYVSLDMSGGNNGPRVLGGSSYPTGIINLTGSLVATTGTVTPNQTTVVFKGNQQTVPAMQFYNLDLTGGFATAFVNAPVYVSNVFTPSSITDAGGLGTIVFNGVAAQTVPSFGYNGLTLTGARAGNISIPSTLNITGNLSLAGLSFTSGSLSFTGNTINLSGAAAEAIDGNAAYPYNNITIANTAGVVTSSTDLAINGALTINAGAILDIGNGQLAGSGISITNNGTIRTQNTGTTPIPSGISYGGTVKYNSTTGTQNIVATTYNNLDISGGTTGGRILPNGGTVTITSNYLPNTSGTLTTTGSTVVFSGVNSQAINSATSFTNLQINKTNTTNALNISGAVSVSGVFSLTKGRVTTTATNTFTLTNSATLSGGSAIAYIDGPLVRTVAAGSTSYPFPVGIYASSTDYYLPDTITATSAAGNITIAAFNGSTGGTADGTTVNSISNNEYWRVSSSVANTIGIAITPISLGSNKVIAQGSSSTTPAATYSFKGGAYNNTSITTTGLALSANTNTYLVAAVATIAAPAITGVSSCVPLTAANSFYARDTITITGTGFETGSVVTVGGQSATVLSTSGVPISLKILVNTSASNNTITVSNSGGTTTNTSLATFINGYATRYDGSFGTGTTWLGASTPSSNFTATINNAVSIGSTVSGINNLTVSNGASLSNANAGVTFNAGATITNNGSFTFTSNTTTFNGAATINGTTAISFNSIITGNTLTFNTAPTINGTLSLNSGASIAGNSPNYGSSSTIAYNTGAVTNPGVEWVSGAASGAGVPVNVTIGTSASNTVVSFGSATAYRQITGALTISAATTGNGLVLSTASGGDLKVTGGNGISATQVASSAYNSAPGGLVCNGRMVYFNAASGSQSLTGPATGNPLSLDYVTIGVNNTSTTTINLGSDIAITAINGGDPVTLTNLGTTNYINSNNSAVSTRNITLGTAGQTCTGSVYIRAGGTNTSSLTINGNGTGSLNINIDNGGGNAYLNALVINNANVSLLKPITYVKSFTLSAGSFNVNSQNFTDSSTANIGSGSSTTTATFTLPTTSGTYKFVGGVNINSDGVWSNTGNNANVTFQGGISNSGTFTAGTGTYTFNTNSQAIAGTLSIPNVTVTSPTVVTNNGTLTVSTALSGTGSLTQGSNSTLNLGGTYTIASMADTATGNTVNFNGTGAQNIPANSYYHLSIGGSRGTNSVTLVNGSTINIAGNYIASASFSTGNYIVTNNTINLNGTASQSIGATTLNSLTINNAAGATLNSAATIMGTLTLTSGNIALGNNNLTINSGSAIASASSSSYIVTNGTGRLVRKAVSTATAFPLGTSTSYSPINITNNIASDMTVGVSPTITNAVSDYSKIVNLQWSVAAATATSSTTLLYQFNTADQATSFAVGNSCEVGIYNTSYATSTIGTPASLGGNAYSLTKSGLAFAANTTYLSVLGNVNSVVNNCTPGSYVGANGGDANSVGNWCGGLPTSSTNVIIATNVPKLTTNLSVNNLTLSSGLNLNGYNLTVNGVLSGTGTITGSASSGITMLGTGTLNFDQTTPGTTNVLDTLVVNSSGTVALGNGLNVINIVKPTAGILASGGNLTLVSNATTGTARVSQGGINGGYITGKVTQQLYIPSKTARKSSYIGSTVTQRVDSAWQQQIYITGTGTGGTVCGTGGSKFNSNGFDKTQSNKPSMYTCQAVAVNGSRWISVPNTNATLLTPGTGYSMNIRGDRNTGSCADQLNSLTPAAPTSVVLSATGLLAQGPVTVALNDTSNYLYSLLANPYPCQMRFTAFQAANPAINNKMWTYSHYGNGNYTTYSNGLVTNAATGYNDTKGDFIAIGQAFFVEANKTGTSVTFRETHKIDSTIPNFSYFGTSNEQLIRMGMYTTNDTLLDEVAVRYHSQGTKGYNPTWDATSFDSGTQTLCIQKDSGYLLAIATRPLGLKKDTVRLSVASTVPGSFRFRFTGLVGFDSTTDIVLLDNLLGTRQNITISPLYDFAITSDTNSRGKGRFVLVIGQAGTLPVTFTGLDGNIVNGKTVLNWGVANEANISSYVVEKSIDGFVNKGIATVKAAHQQSYTAIDPSPDEGANYYRVKALGLDGSASYSNTIQVQFSGSNPQLSLYPTLIVANAFNLHFKNMPAGTYNIVVYNLLGQAVLSKTIQYAGGEATQAIDFGNSKVASGAYEVQVTNKGSNIKRMKVVVE
ncbi:beta strand repeat-containing protein [Parasediminibacterium sp. JCM 36343]|uniref:beta strand repeat-containing protein n=1 Tax=Parasediminibacterium sp. JCM 36343 TaxID=3374279 RepID=UPI00397833A7